jgi:predicted dehydrogenase
MGSYYAYNFSRIGEADIVICCDPSPKKLATFQEKWGIPHGTTTWQDLVDGDRIQLDGIINCSIDKVHEAVFIACIEGGIPLFQEKPLAVHLKQVSRYSVDDLSRWPFIVNFSKRWLPAVQEARERIANGSIGELHKLELHYRQGWLQNHDFGDWHSNSAWFWRLSSELSHHGVIGDLASHLLDLAVLFGGNVRDISCSTSVLSKDPLTIDGKKLDSVDEAVCTLHHENEVFSLVHASRAVPGEADTLEVLISGGGGTIKISSKDPRGNLRQFRVETGEWKTLQSRQPEIRNHRIFADMLVNEMRHPFLPDGTPRLRDAIYNEILIAAAVHSTRSNGAVKITNFATENKLEAWL